MNAEPVNTPGFPPLPQPVRACHAWKSNGDMIAEVARLGYLDGHVLDASHGLGVFWSDWKPERLTAHDLEPAKAPDGALDVRELPARYDRGTFDAAVWDPPYKMRGASASPSMDYRYGTQESATVAEIMALVLDGVTGCAAVLRRRGYLLVKCQDQVCVDEATEILTQRGWLSCDEIAVGDIAYTLNHDNGLGEWQPVTDVWILPSRRRAMLSMKQRGHSSLTTLDHQWATIRNGKRRWAMSRNLAHHDAIPIAAPSSHQPTEPKYSDAFVELVAWFWTEGTVGGLDGRRGGALRASPYGAIYQSRTVNPAKCARIERCLAECFGAPKMMPGSGPFAEREQRWTRRRKTETMDEFALSANALRLLLEVAPGKIPSIEFLRSLTTAQLRLFIEVSIAGDGHDRGNGSGPVFIQKPIAGADAFQIACALAGIATSVRQRRNGIWEVQVRKSETTMPFRRNHQIVEHEGRVWCVTTPASTWLARREGTMWFTGNCGGDVYWQTDEITAHAETLGFDKVDRFDLLGGGRPQPAGRAQQHAYGRPSTLLVFRGKRDRPMQDRLL